MKNTFFMLFFSIAISFIACGGSGENDENLLAGNGNTEKPKEDESQEPVVCSITPIGELNQGTPIINSHADVTNRSSLMMNYRMLVTMESSYPRYPCIKKMKNGDYILFYHNGSANNNIGRRCVYALSKDLKTWSNKGEIFNSYDIIDSKGNKNIHCYANCDGLVLSNGDILAVASCRANSGYRDLPEDAGIELKRSTDNGVTWSEPIKIYQGVNWEPFLLELPTGELHCYFTDSSRTGLEGHGTDTGTAMVVSTDGGKTWKPDFSSSPYYVLRMRWEKNGIVGYNHQMPSVVRLNDNKGLAAAVETKAEGICHPIILGNDEAIEKLAKELDLSLEGIEIVNLRHPGEAPRRERYARILSEKRAREGFTYEEANDKMFERNYFGMMMVETGDADAFITGLYTRYSNTIKVAKEVIGIQPGFNHFGTMHILNSKKGTYFLADTLINRHPDTETLIDIAKLADKTVRFFNHTPVISMLSYSNFGADTSGSPVKVHGAVNYMQKEYPELAIDGEMQVNFAMNRELRDAKYPFTRLKGKDVNTLIFPNLSSANAGYKLLQAMDPDTEFIGPIQMGLNKPIHFTDFESSVRDIVNITAVAVIDAIVVKKKNESR